MSVRPIRGPMSVRVFLLRHWHLLSEGLLGRGSSKIGHLNHN